VCPLGGVVVVFWEILLESVLASKPDSGRLPAPGCGKRLPVQRVLS
jgi:hypothetical protein